MPRSFPPFSSENKADVLSTLCGSCLRCLLWFGAARPTEEAEKGREGCSPAIAHRFSVLWATLLPAASNPLSWKKLVKSGLKGEELAQRVRNKGILTLLLASSCLSRYSKVVAVAPGSNSAILFLCSTLIRLCWASCQKAAPALGQ